jgi:tetratricopeptide (TPR) repeat protein
MRVLVYGLLAGTITYLQPLPRCYFNVFGEDNVLGSCLATGEKLLLRGPYRAYALERAAGAYQDAGRLPEAVILIERAFTLDPEMERGRYQVLEMLFAAGRQQRAIKNFGNALDYYSRAAAHAPDNPVVLLERAATFLDIAAYDSAMADYTRVIVLRPADGAIYRQRALARWQALKDPAGALVDFEKAIALGDKRSLEYRAQVINLK